MTQYFTAQELDTLYEAMEAWEDVTPDDVSSISSQKVMGLFTGEISKEDFIQYMNEQSIGQRQAKKSRREVSTLLKAKIIQARDAQIALEALQEASDAKKD